MMMMMMTTTRLLEVEGKWQGGGKGWGGGSWVHVLEFLDFLLGLWMPTQQASKQMNFSHITLFIQINT